MEIENNIVELEKLAIEYRKTDNDWKRTKPLLLYGPPGIGKTQMAMEYCDKSPYRLYFSFKNLAAGIAPQVWSEVYPDILDNALDWKIFFSCITSKLGSRPIALVFDDWIDGKDKELFWIELIAFLNNRLRNDAFIVMITDCCICEESNIFVKKEMWHNSLSRLSKAFREIDIRDVMRLYVLSDGGNEVAALYDQKKSFAENLRNMMQSKAFMEYGNRVLATTFRTPESYTAILYAISKGITRLSDIADFAGYSNNKCERYLKMLIRAGIVKLQHEKSKDRRSTSRYIIPSGRMLFWSRWCMYYRPLIAGKGEDTTQIEKVEYIDDIIVPKVFRKLCFDWVTNHRNISRVDSVEMRNRVSENCSIKGINFDYVFEGSRKKYYVKIWTDMNQSHNRKDFELLEKAVETQNFLADSVFFLCSIRRFRDSLWEESRTNDNLHLLEARFLAR